MRTVSQYGQAISELGLGNLEIKISCKEDAKSALAKLRSLQRHLRIIKSEVSADIKQIRADHAAQFGNAGAGGALVATLFGKRGLAKNLQASARRSLKQRRDEAVRPYEAVKRTIDSLMCQIENAKAAAQRYLAA